MIAKIQRLEQSKKKLVSALRAGSGPAPTEDAELANSVFCIYAEQVKGRAKADAKMPGDQRTLEAYT